ncbi:MAG: hypothetical protein HZA89_06965 [Verrucomicrobia bacterium]|nr:hypothetical protein [Verrucomicrobiota bacterium]
MINKDSKFAFFRQSAWLMIAITAGGAFAFAVHKVASLMPGDEYSLFNTLLSVFNLFGIPSVGLGTVFAQQAAAAVTEEQRRQLAALARAVLRVTFVIWLVLAGATLVFQNQILATLNISNPAALWITVVVGLVSLWLPVMMGLLQGTQNFLWIGWVAIFNGVGRFLAIFIIVKWLGGWAAGAMFGTLLGALVALGVAAWQTRALWLGPGAAFEWREWLLIVGPLTAGLGASIFMQNFDMIVVRSFFPQNNTELYAAGMKIGYGLIMFTSPMTAVMFPKIARSAALAEKTSVLWQALGVTALVGGGTALGCTLFPELPLKFVYRAKFLEIQWLVPWSVWAMLPLALANVLLNNLMARRRFAAVPWLALVAAGYGAALWVWHGDFLQVAQVLGVFNLLFLGVCVWFTWRRAPGTPT